MKFFLPCHLPDPEIAKSDFDEKLDSIIKNINYIRRRNPGSEIHLYNNGKNIHDFNYSDVYLWSESFVSKDPSIGEALMLEEFLNRNSGIFIKLHARCQINNLQHFVQSSEENIFFLKKNVLSRPTTLTIDSLPYVDTRTFKANSKYISALFNCAIKKTVEGGINIEQAFLYAFYKNQEYCSVLKARSFNYPIYFGGAGHGKNYSSLRNQLLQRIKAIFYGFGLS